MPIYSSVGLPDSTEEVNQWIKQVELRLRRLGSGNLGGVSTSATQQAVVAPQVTGLSLVPNINTITVRWYPISSSNLDFYEIQVDDAPSFPQPEVTKQRTLQYTFQSGLPGEEYYVRVRAKVTNGGYGPWSGRLNTSTGRVTTFNMNRGSATTLTDHERDLSAYAVLDPQAAASSPLTQTYPGTVVKAEGGTLLPFVSFEYKVASRWNNSGDNYVKTTLYRSGPGGVAVLDNVSVDYYSTAYGDYDTGTPANSTLGDIPLLGLGTPDDPGFGVFTYFLEIEVASNLAGASYLRVQPMSINLEIVELRN